MNGNLGASKAFYREGDSIPYRLTFSNLATGNSAPHKVTIEWDTTKSSKHALDYIDTWNQSVTTANPCLGVSGCSGAPTSQFNIPADPQNSAITQLAGKLSMWGGTITGVECGTGGRAGSCSGTNPYFYSNGTGFSGDKSASITVDFVATVANPVLAWGGHIATRHDWGTGGAAVNIPGSPYHTRLIDLDGSGGNQDRSLSAEAVVFPGFIHIVKNTSGGDGTFSYTASPSPLSDFQITTTSGSGEKDFDLITNFTTYTVAEQGPSGDFTFTGLTCSIDPNTANGGTQSVSGQTATINLKEGEEVTCTYTNTKQSASLSLTKTAGTSDVCTGSSTSVTYTYVVTNTGQVALSGTVTDDQLGSIGSFNLAAGASTTLTKTTTVTGTLTNNATATGTSTGGQTATATASATVTGHTCTITVTKSAANADVCNGTSGSYTITVTNNSDQFSWTGSVVDNVLGTLDASLTLAPGGSHTYTTTHSITGAVTDTVTASGAFNDPASTSASNTASATVTGHVCTISVTKSPSQTSVCNGSSVTYTITVTNNSDQFSWTGSVVDNVLGTLDASLTLAPGGSHTYTPSGTINGTVTNTVTASGAFNDPASTSASNTASATVTGNACGITVTKSAANADVCNGTSGSYTITVTNNSTQFSWTGSVVDNVLGTLDASLTLAPGGSHTYTTTHAITGTVTDTVTASGAFNDPASTSASNTASATVTGHVCTISVTKSPSQTSVCNGSSVSYTITVTNNSDQFSWTGSVVDNVLGTLDASLTLAPGGSHTYTPSGTINGTVTNTVTASGAFNDPASTSASNTASATVTGHVCTISVTKSPSQTSVCNGTSVTYTITVTNNSDTFTWTGSVNDTILGQLAASLTLAPGASQTYTTSHSITGTVTDTVTASGAFNDPASTSASNTASATVTGSTCNTAQITPTATTCSQFAGNTASTLTQIQYSTKQGKINQVNPGVFFYWVKVTNVVAGLNTFTINQQITTGNFTHLFTQAAGSNVFDSGCNTVSGATIDGTAAAVTVSFNAASAGTYYIGIKYNTGSVVGFAPPTGGGTAHYTFTLGSDSSTTAGLDLAKK